MKPPYSCDLTRRTAEATLKATPGVDSINMFCPACEGWHRASVPRYARCECGAASVKSPTHSDWCPIK